MILIHAALIFMLQNLCFSDECSEDITFSLMSVLCFTCYLQLTTTTNNNIRFNVIIPAGRG